MYHREIVAKNIQDLSTRLGRELRYYPADYVQECVEVLQAKAVLDDKGQLKELRAPLTEDEQLFIQNEQLLCTLDFDYWSTHYHKIRDSNTQQMIPFRRNFAQEVLNGVYCEQQLRGVPIMIQSLKARQLGVTTDTTARILHRALFIPNTSGVLASSDEDKTWKLSEMLSRSLRQHPWWLIPEDFKQYASGEVFLESPRQVMTLGIQHGRQTSGISRGDTINAYHLSELPDFTDAEALIEAGLMKTMHPTELTIGVKESTANGRGNYWHKLWLSNCAEYPKGLSLEIPIFLPWYLGTDIYPTEVWLRAIPIPVDWQPSEHIIRHAEKAREYVLENKLLWQALGLGWRMPLSQMWFYHVEYERAKAKGEESLAKFYSEMPANDTQAFQSLTGSVFSIEQIQVYEDRLVPVAGSYKFLGPHVPAPLLPESSEIIPEAPIIPITHLTPQGKSLSWTLVPVATSPTDMSGLNRLLLWEAPIPGAEYVVSLDGAEGKGQDRTAMSIWKKGTPLNPPTQVGELASDNIATLEVWPIWLALLNHFSLPGQPPAMAAPEINRGGDAALMQIMQQGWTNAYRRVELASLRSVVSNYKLGWETTPKTRDQLIQWILFVVKGHWAQINSKYLLEELRDFVTVQLQRKIRLEAGAGAKDDRIFAFIIALVCLHGVDIFNAETPNWRRVVDEKKELLTFPRGGLGQHLPTLPPEELPGSIQISYYS